MEIRKEIRTYTTASGKAPFYEWLAKQDRMAVAKIRRRLDRLMLGYYGDTKSIGDGVLELRIAFGPGYRVYFAESEGAFIILLCAGHKGTQVKDIERAKKYWNDLKKRIKQ